MSGARLNDRMCIKTLGYHHFLGLHGFPKSDKYSICKSALRVSALCWCFHFCFMSASLARHSSSSSTFTFHRRFHFFHRLLPKRRSQDTEGHARTLLENGQLHSWLLCYWVCWFWMWSNEAWCWRLNVLTDFNQTLRKRKPDFVSPPLLLTKNGTKCSYVFWCPQSTRPSFCCPKTYNSLK